MRKNVDKSKMMVFERNKSEVVKVEYPNECNIKLYRKMMEINEFLSTILV